MLPGVEEEKIGVIKRGGRFLFAFVEASVPIVTVVIRKAYGGAWAVMGCKQLGADINLAWPTARIAVMGAESAVELIGPRADRGGGRESAPAVRKQFIDFYNATMATPWIAAERGYTDCGDRARDHPAGVAQGADPVARQAGAAQSAQGPDLALLKFSLLSAGVLCVICPKGCVRSISRYDLCGFGITGSV